MAPVVHSFLLFPWAIYVKQLVKMLFSSGNLTTIFRSVRISMGNCNCKDVFIHLFGKQPNIYGAIALPHGLGLFFNSLVYALIQI